MSDVPFYRTQMGHRFFEATVPALVRELARLNGNLERLALRLEQSSVQPQIASEPGVAVSRDRVEEPR